MSDTAFQTVYRQELIAGYEFGQSMLATATTNQAMVTGNQAVFLVADSGAASAVTRGVNGLIPARPDNNTQSTATLAEWHDLVRKTGFNIFASQGDQRSLMQRTTMKVINRKVDLDIIAALDTASHQVSAVAQTMSSSIAVKAETILANNYVDTTDMANMFAVCSPAAYAYLRQTPEFANGQWVDVKPFIGPVRKYWNWAGFNWIKHPLLTGNGTSSEKCYFFHRDAIGHVVDTGGLKTAVGYDDEQDYSYCRVTTYIGSLLLQQTGIVQFLHDGSGMAGT